MKKKALRKDFYMEVKTSFSRFMSIFLIVCLGVAFFAGIRASSPDMKLSADSFYKESSLMDIRVVSTLGLTDNDLEEIKNIENVETVMSAYSIDMLCDTPDSQYVVRMMSYPDSLNLITVKEGRMPEKEGECLADTAFLKNSGFEVGDVLNLRSGTDDEVSDSLITDTYKIVGSGVTSYYLSLDRGSSTIGNGELTGFLIVPTSDFCMDCYTDIYIGVKDAKEMEGFSDEYEDYIDTVEDAIEAIADRRCDIRYSEVVDEANQKISDGEDEIADAKKELADAKKELDDGQKEVDDGRIELDDAKVTLSEKEDELIDAKKKLSDAKQEIADGEKELADATRELIDAKKELDDGKAEIEENQKKLDDSRLTVIEGKQKLRDGQAQIDDGRFQIGQKRQEIAAAREQIKYGRSQIPPLPQIPEGVDPTTIPGYEDAVKLIAQKTAELDAMEAQLDAGEAELNANENLLNDKQKEIDEGWDKINEGEFALLDGLAQLEDARKEWEDGYNEYLDGLKEYNDGVADLNEGKKKYADGLKEVADGEVKIADAKAELEDYEKELADGIKELEDGKKEYNDARQEADEKIADAESDLADAKQKIADLDTPEWYILDRNTIETYVEFIDDANRIAAIGLVFPAIFFLVAALVSLTTMTRMVEEERMQIGTLKALGYSNGSIMAKYLLYAFIASFFGSILGLLIGQKIIPYVVIVSYEIMYNNLEVLLMPLNPYYSISSTLIAILCTTVSTFFACYKELLSTPALLMRPVAPKGGKRVFLEKIGFLWKSLNFTQKATIRNLLRYKKRFLMTIFGIGGCMGLLLVGFGIKDSITSIVECQFDEIRHYQADIVIDEDATDEDRQELFATLSVYDKINSYMKGYQEARDIEGNNVTKNGYLVVFEKPEEVSDFICLRERIGHKELALNDEGVIITEKIAKLTKTQVGDTIRLKEDETTFVDVPVIGICENYFMHYVYMSPALYEKIYGETIDYSQVFLSNADNSEEYESALGETLLSLDAVAGINFYSGMKDKVAKMIESMDLVIWVLVVAAGGLAFVVLYNLNNINITERRRELATLKVLGFYDKEVAGYVNRENVILTIIGAAVGCVIGIFLHRYIILTVELDIMMFGRIIRPASFVYSILLTFLFAIIVALVMHFRLKKIDMVESLKSVE